SVRGPAASSTSSPEARAVRGAFSSSSAFRSSFTTPRAYRDAARASAQRLLEPFERLCPAVTMKLPAWRGLELSVVEDEASAEISRLERQRDQRLLVVGTRLFVDERVRKAVWRLDREERTADVEHVPFRRLHDDPVLPSFHGIELKTHNRESGRAPPVPELLSVDERSEDIFRRRRQGLFQVKSRPGRVLRLGHVASIMPREARTTQ